MKSQHLRIIACAMLAAAYIPKQATAETVTVTDTTFTNWVGVRANDTNVSSVSIGRSAGTGLSGDELITSISGSYPMYYDVRLYKTDFNWVPSVRGGIATISYELWHRCTGEHSFHITEFIARQGQTEYIAHATKVDANCDSPDTWKKNSATFDVTNLTRVNGPGPQMLDFSAGAPPIQFGYRISTDSALHSPVNVRKSFFVVNITTQANTYYADNDHDSYGNPASSITSPFVAPPAGYVANNTDCDDTNAAIHPGAAEILDGKDNDCNGQTDEGYVGSRVLYSNGAVGIRSSPTAFGGKAYFGDDAARLHAVDTATGLEAAPFPIALPASAAILARPALYFAGNPASAALYVVTDTGRVSKVLLDGTVAWTSVPPGAEGRTAANSMGNASTPAVDSGAVFVGLNDDVSGSYLEKIDDADGHVLARSLPLGSGASRISSVAVVGANIYVGMTNGASGIYLLTSADLTIRAAFAPGESVSAPPFITGAEGYIAALSGHYFRVNGINGALDPSFGGTGVVTLGQPLQGSPFPYLAPEADSRSTTYVGSTGGNVWKVAHDGSVLSLGSFGGSIPGLGGVSDFSVAYAPAFGAGANFIQLSTTGGPAKSIPLGGAVTTVPTLDRTPGTGYPHGRYIVAAGDNNVYAVRVFYNGE